MHRKILVIDKELVLLGTANFTTQSLKMHDNLILGIWSQSLALFLQDSIEDFGCFEIGDMDLKSFLLPDSEERAIPSLCSILDKANRKIQIAMFTLTHPKLIERLIAAKNRGAQVQLVIDRYTAKGASKKAVKQLKDAGIEISLSTGSKLFHHKWAWIDNEILVMGSANWTSSAFVKNQDCLLILRKIKNPEKKQIERIWKNIALSTKIE